MLDPHHGKLGRRYSTDARDRLAARFIDLERPRGATTLRWRYWYERWNQDQTGGTCVANTFTHRLGDSPHTWPLAWLDTFTDRHPLADQTGASLNLTGYVSQQSGQSGFRGALYDQAQLVDEWADTPPEGGTSGRAACKVLQRWGFINAYYFLDTVDEVAQAVLNQGPVGIGVNWHADDYYGLVDRQVMRGTGSVVGGHEVLLSGVNLDARLFRVQTWGMHLRLPFDVLGALLEDDGDAIIVTEPT